MTAVARETALLALFETIRTVRSDCGGSCLAVVEKTMPAGAMTPLHVHEADEMFYVLEGAMTIHAGDRTVRLGAGEAFLAPQGVPHTSWVDSDRVRYLAMSFVPSVGRYEDFLRAVGEAAAGAASSGARSWPCDQELAGLGAIAAANRITILGSPGMLPGDLDAPPGRVA